jgi:hypothetical protein
MYNNSMWDMLPVLGLIVAVGVSLVACDDQPRVQKFYTVTCYDGTGVKSEYTATAFSLSTSETVIYYNPQNSATRTRTEIHGQACSATEISSAN